jgi:nitrogen-specific signal transduction histidine kinase
MTPTTRHEINNVLAALMAEAQLLQMDELTPEQMQGTDRIVSHARRLRDLLRSVQSTPEAAAEAVPEPAAAE